MEAYCPQTEPFRGLPALKVETFWAGILIFFPVWGFLPSRAFYLYVLAITTGLREGELLVLR